MTHSLTFAEAKLTVKAKVWDEAPFTLKKEIATAKLPDDSKVFVDSVVNNGTLLVRHGDGQTYEISMEQVCAAVLRHEEMAIKAEKVVSLVKSELDGESNRLAEKLMEYVFVRYPHYRSTMKAVPTAKAIQLLHKQDELFTYIGIENVMKWLFEVYEPMGSFDWREQVRSGVKFRKHFPALVDLIRKEYQTQDIPTIG